jgi:predicted nucleic acid-binding protein
MPLNIVVDASVVIKAYIPEILSDRAAALLKRLERRELFFVVSDLIFEEIGNILWKKHRLKELSVSEVEEISKEILSLPLKVIPAKSILLLAIDVGIAYEITVYDALYISVATIHETKLVAADRRLVDKFIKTPLKQHIEWLGK